VILDHSPLPCPSIVDRNGEIGVFYDENSVSVSRGWEQNRPKAHGERHLIVVMGPRSLSIKMGAMLKQAEDPVAQTDQIDPIDQID
jgi:hypothetical protein